MMLVEAVEALGTIWRQSTTPSAGATYEWTGATNNSTSVERVDGVVTRTNLTPIPYDDSVPDNETARTPNYATPGAPQGLPRGGYYTIDQGSTATTDEIASFYDLDGMQSSGTPARKTGFWLYTSVDAQVRGDQEAYGDFPVQPAGTWRWMVITTPANTWSGLYCRRADRQPVTHDVDYVIITGITTLAGTTEPTEAIWGDRPDQRSQDVWIDDSDTYHRWSNGWQVSPVQLVDRPLTAIEWDGTVERPLLVEETS